MTFPREGKLPQAILLPQKMTRVDLLLIVPITSFEAKKWLEVNFPSRGKVINFPSSHKTPFSQTLHFMGKLAILRERESYFQGKIIPQRVILPQKMFRVKYIF